MSTNEKKHPKGYWMAVGISIGVAIGVAIGSGLGASLEQKNKDNIRPLTEQEQKRQKLGVVIGLALFGVLVLALIIAYFLVGK